VLPLQRIELLVLPDNIRAQRCYEKAGFVKEGLLRNYIYNRGKAQDMVIMSILHREWAENNPRLA
jgi:RimJ/RimL family protein N-acetyltransferase